MQNKIYKTLSVLIITCLSAAQVMAHGIWLEQRRGNIEVVYGHGSSEDDYLPERVIIANGYDKSGKNVALKKVALNNYVRLAYDHKPYVIATVLDNGQYAKMPNGKWLTQKIGEKIVGADKNMHIYKYSLAILQEGAKIPALKELRLVIIPETDPTKVAAGSELPVKVLVDGKPTAGVELVADYRSGAEIAAAVTDNKGRAKIKVRNADLNIISAEYALPVSEPAVNEILMHSTLTFSATTPHEGIRNK